MPSGGLTAARAAFAAEGVSAPLDEIARRSGADVTSSISTVSLEMRDALGVLLDRAQRAGAIRDDVGIAELMVLIKGSLLAVQQSGDAAVGGQVFAVLRDGLRA